MHRSRLSTLLVDVPAADAGRSAAFWSGALGAPPRHPPGEPGFTELAGAVPGLVTAVQALGGADAPRYHVDLETDDVDAEVARLVGLGAVEVSAWQGCRTLRAPGGHLLCVVPLHSDPGEFAAAARTWP
ncbi:VOC family protein [Vallicoccus soli]|uniref:VOC family protein n=1 Tax=Vallicoccus soli TaxID=2339232 RepID=A0A3A3YZZ6_9ACTN|nr:VOC family protein [Vallicoccus soli]RJK94762.1 VOC family protein [Vallicoccus soli]